MTAMKYTGKLLALLLALATVVTMLPTAWAEDVEEIEQIADSAETGIEEEATDPDRSEAEIADAEDPTESAGGKRAAAPAGRMQVPDAENGDPDDDGEEEDYPNKSQTAGPNLTWTYDGTTHTLTVSGTGETWSWSDGTVKPWSGCAVKTAIIEKGVTEIGDSAFGMLRQLSSVTIPESVTTIGNSAFICCYGLTSVIVPDSVTRIGESAFGGCTSLKSVVLPNGLETIEHDLFAKSYAVTNVVIPRSVTEISDFALDDCRDLTISGYAGSYAESFAKENDIPFCAIDLPTPALPTLTSDSDGVIVRWKAVTGAEKYRIYRRIGSGSLEILGETAETEWFDQTVEGNQTYSYSIACITAEGGCLVSDFNRTGKSILCYYRAPEVTALQAAPNGIIINWDPVTGADKYRVFRKAGS